MGTNWLDYSGYNVGVTVDLLTHSATAISGTTVNINNILGSRYNDSLTGDDNANIINAFGGSDVITGNGGDDTFIFPLGASFSGTLDGGAGNDTADFSAYTTPLAVLLTGTAADGFNGTINGQPFTSLNLILAGSASTDSLQGLNAAATWNRGSIDQYSSLGRTLRFSVFRSPAGRQRQRRLCLRERDRLPGLDTSTAGRAATR